MGLRSYAQTRTSTSAGISFIAALLCQRNDESVYLTICYNCQRETIWVSHVIDDTGAPRVALNCVGTDVRNLESDQLIDGRFQIQAKIGEGGQGVVYRVFDLNRNRLCALKLLCADDGDEDSRARFRREGRLGENLRHANLVEVFESDKRWRGQLYLVMELLEGMVPLAELWAELDWPRFLAIVTQVAAALDYLAGYDLVHRDVSPSNVLVDRADKVKVIDLGLAREAGSGITRSSMVDVMGSPGYLPPEQLERPKCVEPASDQWALAAIVYEALTGIPPHFDDADHEDGVEMSALQRLADAVPMSQPCLLNETVGEALDSAVLRALATDPTKRFSCCRDFVDEVVRSSSPEVRLQRAGG